MKILLYRFKCFFKVFSLFVVPILFSCNKNVGNAVTSPTTTPTPPTVVSHPTTYQLTWADEFDSSAINTNNWNFETGGGGWGNNESEYYQSANATVSNGNLIITAKKESAGSNLYTSARMNTQGKKEFTYGKIEARIKLTVGQGLWPAFWMLGANIKAVNWPQCGETDIMEHINADSIVYGTIHWDNNGHVQDGKSTSTTPSDYHIYAVEWDSASIKWLVDGNVYHQSNILNNINGTDEFHKPFFILLNFAVGGNWPGQVIDESKLPAKMYIDYVRVYKAK